MDNRSEIREFLASRRAKITPGQVGLPAGGTRRRVPGLRREEVAVLAGVSTEWYTRLEKGHISGVSEDVLEAVAGALRLDEAERIYLFDLARAAKPARTPQRRSKATVRPSVHSTESLPNGCTRGATPRGAPGLALRPRRPRRGGRGQEAVAVTGRGLPVSCLEEGSRARQRCRSSGEWS